MPDERMGRDLAEVMAEVARRLDSPETLDEQLQRVLDAAVETVPGVDEVSISVLSRKGRATTVASTGSIASGMDVLQYELDEGPCLDALRGEPFQLVDDMPAEQRWPRYAPKAADSGVRSQLGLQLFNDNRTIGGLNLYSTQAGAFDSDTRYVAALFASHAARAMGRTRQVEELTEALNRRKVIGQALGIVMERHGLDEERAFQFLTRVSRTSNIKLRDVAHQLVSERDAKAHASG